MNKEQIRRICLKCLPKQENEEENYFSSLRTYIENLDSQSKVSESDYALRLSLCGQCEKLTEGMCRACGCFVELRAVLRKNACPHEHWGRISF
jgi:hypothetical protein